MSKTTVVSAFGTFTDEQLNTLKKGLREFSDVMSMMESQKEVMKDILGSLYDELKIPKKLIRKMAVTYHKKNFSEVTAENEEFEVLYEGVISQSQEN
jgi:Transcriptional regulator DsbA|nr:MAG: hypothetical protein [Caudoviricetes sp.]